MHLAPDRTPALAGARRSPASRSLRTALGLLAATALALAAIEIAAYAGTLSSPLWALAAMPALGLLYLAVGAVCWLRQPSNGTGILLSLCGLALLAAGLGNTELPVPVAVGVATAELPAGVLLHLLLAFPSGRLPDRVSRVLAGCGYGVTLGLHAPSYLLSGEPWLPSWLRLADRPDLASLAADVKSAAAFTVIALTAAVLVRRLRSADALQRRALAPVTGYGVLTILFLTGSFQVAQLLQIGAIPLFVVQMAALAGLPVAVAVAVLRGGFARAGELAELMAWLGAADRDRSGLRTALAQVLGDPSVQLWFWLPERMVYVDAAGRPAPGGRRGRGMVEVHLAAERVGAIEYDATLLADPEAVRAAGRMIALHLDRERLTAALLARDAALRESRARLVTAADTERRRIVADLHDGLQGQLVLLAMQAGAAAADPQTPTATRERVGGLRAGLEVAIADLRRLVHGVLPALLVQRGLVAAVEELLDRTPMISRLEALQADQRFPAAVESAAYFLVAESLANAVKHSAAGTVEVRLASCGDVLQVEVRDDGVGGAVAGLGSGLRGMSDRVEALGGRVQVDSPPRRGTRVLAELPCGS